MAESERKPIIFSGIKPSGDLQLGNYIGAIRNWITLQETHDCLYCVVDLHAITVRQDPTELRRRALDLLSTYIACGLDPEKNTMYMQSHVPAHAQLGWILDCYAYMGELSRMTQYKEKSAKSEENLNAGLFTYPVLMAADILLYQSDLVPVGEDQKQHLELARDLAIRFNNAYGNTFVVPDCYTPKVGARVMSLTNPSVKMGKSEEDAANIYLLDAPDLIRRKMRRAVTDLGSEVRAGEDKPGVTNLMSIYSATTGQSMEQVEETFAGKGYGAFKDGVADAVIAVLEPIQQKYAKVRSEKAYLTKIMTDGAQEASRRAMRTLSKVHRKVGLAPFEL